MSQTFPLSPSFERARKLSRVMAVVFTVGFWMALAGAVVMLAVPFIPLEAHTVVGLGSISVGGVPPRDAVGLGDIRVSLNGLSFGQRTWVLLAMEIVLLPIMLLMHHTRRV